MRAEGREVRCVGAIALLTAKQVQAQLALRWALDGLAVKRSGKDSVLRPLLEAEVAKEVAARVVEDNGPAELTVEAEVVRLKALGFGKKARASGVPRQPRAPRANTQPRRREQQAAAAEGSGSDSDESSDESESEEEEEGGIDIDELLQKDDDVFEVEKLLEWRNAARGGRKFLVKWKGYSAKETTWEPEENVLEKGMMRAVLKQPAFGEKARPKPPAARQPAEPTEVAAAAAEPTRARSARASAHVASEAQHAAPTKRTQSRRWRRRVSRERVSQRSLRSSCRVRCRGRGWARSRKLPRQGAR